MVSPHSPEKDAGPIEGQVFRYTLRWVVIPMWQCQPLTTTEETSVVNGPLQVETRRRAEARWPAEPRQPLERALFEHTVTVSA